MNIKYIYIITVSLMWTLGVYFLIIPKKSLNLEVIKLDKRSLKGNLQILETFITGVLGVLVVISKANALNVIVLIGWVLANFAMRKAISKSVLEMVYSQIEFGKQKKMDAEIYKCAIQLKNMSKAQKNKKYPSDIIIERLATFSVHLKPIFAQMNTYWLLKKEKLACEYFVESIGTKTAKEFSSILEKLSQLTLSELLENLDLFIEYVKEENISNQYKRQETLSYILYVPMTGGIFLVMWNVISMIMASQLVDKISL